MQWGQILFEVARIWIFTTLPFHEILWFIFGKLATGPRKRFALIYQCWYITIRGKNYLLIEKLFDTWKQLCKKKWRATINSLDHHQIFLQDTFTTFIIRMGFFSRFHSICLFKYLVCELFCSENGRIQLLKYLIIWTSESGLTKQTNYDIPSVNIKELSNLVLETFYNESF